jgi:hypothetical protein
MRRTLEAVVGVALLAVFASACGRSGDGAVTRGATAAVAPTTTPVTPTTASSTTTAARERLSTSSRLRVDGVGPIRVGMTVDEARAAAGVPLASAHEGACDVLTAPGGPAGLDLIVTQATGRIQVIHVRDETIATVSGIRVGATEEEVLAAYPGRLRTVNPALPRHRLVYEAKDPALADRVVVFVIAEGGVTHMYAGNRADVESDEICA